MKRAFFLALGLLLPGPAAGGDLEQALQDVRPEAVEAHMAFLAHDLLEGRETGSRGYEIAARYVAAQFLLLGLEPAGEEGTFFQWIDFRKTRVLEEECTFVLRGEAGDRRLVYAEHYLTRGDASHEATDVDAPLVYVGYGVSAPELGYDDYEGIDVEGKIVVHLRGAPPTFPHNERAYFSSSRVKSRTAVERGAVGSILFLTPRDASRRPWEKMVINSRIARMRWLGTDGEPQGVFPRLEAGVFLSPEGVEVLFEGASYSLEEVLAAGEAGRPLSFDLPWRAEMVRRSVHEPVRSPNVIGVLPGSDPALRDEFLVYSAHLDHLGMGEEVDGDRIYNGAYDNASGIAVLLEVARAFAGLDRRPRRSVLFLAVTGEEKGLLGSEYFTENPTVPLSAIVADVNLDMFLMLHPLNDVIAFGAEHSDLAGVVEDAASRLGIRVSPDPVPEEVIFVRSDQFNFVRKGIPAVFLVGGEDTGGPLPEGSVDRETWRRDYYHSRRDDMSQYMDFGAGAKFARVNLIIGHTVADRDARPRWNEGDFFGEKFGAVSGSR